LVLSILPNKNANWKSVQSVGLNHVYNVEVPFESFKNWAEENKVDKEIKGFRPGKAPVSFFKDDWVVNAARAVFSEILEKELKGKKIYDSGYSLIKFENGENIEFSLTIEIYPEVPAIKFEDFSYGKYEVGVSKKDVEKALEKWAHSNSKPGELETSRKTQKDDYIRVDIEIKSPDGKVEKMSNVDLQLGKHKFQPEIEEKLTGVNLNEEVHHSFEIPADNPLIKDKSIIGQTITMNFKVVEVRAPKVFQINEEMAAAFDCEKVSELEKIFEKQISKECEDYSDFLAKEQVKRFMSKHVFEIPLNLLRARYDELRNKTLSDLGFKDGSDLEAFIKEKLEINLEEFDKRLVYMAEIGARQSFLLRHFASEWKVEISQAELDDAIANQKSSFPGGLQAAVKFFEENEEAKNILYGNLLEEKVMKKCVSKSKPELKKVSLEELYRVDLNAEANAKPENLEDKEADSEVSCEEKESKAKKPAAKKAPKANKEEK
jgi:trigger factor